MAGRCSLCGSETDRPYNVTIPVWGETRYALCEKCYHDLLVCYRKTRDWKKAISMVSRKNGRRKSVRKVQPEHRKNIESLDRWLT